MGELITLEREEDKPRAICPHCKQVIYVDIDSWKRDITKIKKDRCPKCHGEIIAGLLIILDVAMPRFLNTLRAIMEVASRANKILGGS